MATETSYTSKPKEDYGTKDPTPPSVSEYTKGNAGTLYNSHETSHNVSNTNPTSKAALTIDQAPKSIDAQINELLVQQKNGLLSPENQAKLADLQKQKEAQGSLKQKNANPAVNGEKDEDKPDKGKDIIDYLYEHVFEASLYKGFDLTGTFAKFLAGRAEQNIIAAEQNFRDWINDNKEKKAKNVKTVTYNKHSNVMKLFNEKMNERRETQANIAAELKTIDTKIKDGSIASDAKLLQNYKAHMLQNGVSESDADMKIEKVQTLCKQYSTPTSKSEQKKVLSDLYREAHDFGKATNKRIATEDMAFATANTLTAATLLSRMTKDPDRLANEDIKQLYDRQLSTDTADTFNIAHYVPNAHEIIKDALWTSKKALDFSSKEILHGRTAEMGEKALENPYLAACNSIINKATVDIHNPAKDNTKVTAEYSTPSSIYGTLKDAAKGNQQSDKTIQRILAGLDAAQQQLDLKQQQHNSRNPQINRQQDNRAQQVQPQVQLNKDRTR